MYPMKTGNCGKQGHGPYEKLGTVVNKGMDPMKTGTVVNKGMDPMKDWELW